MGRKNKQPRTLSAALRRLDVREGTSLKYATDDYREDSLDTDAIERIERIVGPRKANAILGVIDYWPSSKSFFDEETGEYVGQ